jgi:hypothetical protein
MPDSKAWDALTDAQLDTVHEHLAQLVCEMVDVPKDPPSELFVLQELFVVLRFARFFKELEAKGIELRAVEK